MKYKKVVAQVQQIHELLESLHPPIAFRKPSGTQNALQMQVEDGACHRHPATRRCEALLATVELYDVPEARL